MAGILIVDQIQNSSNTGQLTFDNSGNFTTGNLICTGTITGGTGLLNIGGGQIYKATNGNVGIGTSSPTELLTTQTTATGTTAGSNNVARFQSNGSGYDANIRLGDNVNAAAALGYLSGSMYFWTNGAERMRLDSSGNLGLGVTPSGWGNNVSVFQGAIGGHLIFNKVNGETALGSNGYYNGSSWIYATSAPAARYAVNGYNGTHAWSYAASGTAGNAITFTQAMTLDASGRLLVNNTYSSGALGSIVSYAGDSAYSLVLRSPNYGIRAWSESSSGGFWIQAVDGTGSVSYQPLLLAGGGVRFWSGTAGGGSISEAARIDSSGNLLIGTTSNLYGSRLNVKSAGDIVSAEFYRQGTAGGSAIVVFNSNATATESLRSYIDTSSGNLTVVSDERVKDNIEDIEYGLSEVLALRPVSFKWKNSFDEQVNLGFIAQEVEQVISNVVTTLTEDISHTLPGQKMMDKESLIPVLVKAIQEQQELIEKLTARIIALESK